MAGLIWDVSIIMDGECVVIFGAVDESDVRV